MTCIKKFNEQNVLTCNGGDILVMSSPALWATFSSYYEDDDFGPHSSFCCDGNFGAHLCCRNGGGEQIDNIREIKDKALEGNVCRKIERKQIQSTKQ